MRRFFEMVRNRRAEKARRLEELKREAKFTKRMKLRETNPFVPLI